SGDTTALVWDIASVTQRKRPNRVAPSPKELEECWTTLAGTDAMKAYRAIGTLTAVPEQSVPFLKQRLQPAPVGEAKRIAALIVDLGSERFAVRRKAAEELEKFVDQAEAALGQKLAEKVPLESRQRIERLLTKLANPSGERLRVLRAIEVLEHIGT